MKKILLAAITTLTRATPASAWQTTTYYSTGNNSISWNSYGNGGFSSGSCYSYGNQIMCNSY